MNCLIEHGMVNSLLNLIKPDSSAAILLQVTWTLCFTWSYQNPPPTVPAVRQVLHAVHQLIDSNYCIEDVVLALSYLTDCPGEVVQEVADAGIVPRLIALLEHKDFIILNLKTIGKIVRVNQTMLAALAYPLLAKLLVHSGMEIVKEGAEIVRKNAAGNCNQIQDLTNFRITTVLETLNNIIFPVVDVLSKGDFKYQKEAAWAITLGGNFEEITLLCQSGDIAPLSTSLCTLLCTLLEAKEPQTMVVVLGGLTQILEAAEKMGDLEKVLLHVKKCGGLDCIIEAMKSNDNVEIYQISLAILERYFSTDLSHHEDSKLAPFTS